MIAAVDTNVLLDVMSASPTHGEASRRAITRALSRGAVMACDIVWAEVVASFPSDGAADEALDRLGIRFAATDPEVARAAGAAWRSSRRRGGPRVRLVSDFLIGAHASMRADHLLTRDRGFYRAYFKRLQIVDPAAV